MKTTKAKTNKKITSKNKSGKLKVYYTNARSIRNKMTELGIIAMNEDLDIILISESWVNTETRDFSGEVCLPGYSLFHKDRTNGREGGGVLMLCKESLQVIEIHCHANNHDIVSVELIGNNRKKVQLTLVYRPGKITAEQDIELYEKLNTLITAQYSIVIGDLNLPHINFGTREASAPGLRFLDFMDNKFMSQMITEPTRGNNILDLLLCTHESMVDEIEIGETLGTSDHNCIRFNIKLDCDSPQNKFMIPNFRLANFDSMRDVLGEKYEVKKHSAEESLNHFMLVMKNAEAKHIPMRIKRAIRFKPKYWNGELQNLQSKKKADFRIWKNNRSEYNKIQFHSSRRKFKTVQRNKQRSYEHEISENAKYEPKQFFSYVSSKKNNRSKVGPLKTTDGTLVTGDQEMCEVLNEFFCSVFTVENEDSPEGRDIVADRNISALESFEIQPQEIFRKINKLKATKTPGPDQAHPRILKETAYQISTPLSIIYNQSLATETCPPQWKEANVTPIFKKGKKDTPGNYRPISLTSVIGKLMEGTLTDKIVEYLERNNLIGNSQHGFRHRRSCLTNLLSFFKNIIEVHDSKSPQDIIYLDFQKAFDKVPHKRLLNKLHNIGIRGKVNKWIESWLSERKQRVVLNGSCSKWKEVTSGVPQGSVLGPLLFLIYIDDLETNLVCMISKFADDTKLSGKVCTAQDRLQIQQDLDKIVEWSEKWQMPFNVDKCKVMHLGYVNVKQDYYMAGRKLKDVEEEKDLGIIISNDLKNGKQCTEAAKKANQMLGMINRTMVHKTRRNMVALYNAFVRPHLEYAVQFWSPYLRKDITKLEKVQRRATKLIPALRNKSYEDRLADLKLFSLEKRRVRNDMIEVWKIITGHENIDRNSLFELEENGITRNNGYKIVGKRFQSEIAKNWFTYRVVNEWNRLPNLVVGSKSLVTFKKRLDDHYRSQG